MAERRPWTKEETTLALALYLKTPYSKISKTNPEIQKLAALLNRSVPSVTLKLSNLASLDEEVLKKGKKGSSHRSRLDEEVWDEYIAGTGRNLEKLLTDVDAVVEKQKIQEAPFLTRIGIDKFGTVKIRAGQDIFREQILASYGGRCAATGLSCRSLVEAAHILPWSQFPNVRLNADNGIALNVLVHRAFDADLLGIDADFKIHISEQLKASEAESPQKIFTDMDGRSLFLPSRFIPRRGFLEQRFAGFLRAHR